MPEQAENRYRPVSSSMQASTSVADSSASFIGGGLAVNRAEDTEKRGIGINS
jgi:hypothetical protein